MSAFGRWTKEARKLLDHVEATQAGNIEKAAGPGSTLANTAVVNEIKVRTSELLAAQGMLPPALTSA